MRKFTLSKENKKKMFDTFNDFVHKITGKSNKSVELQSDEKALILKSLHVYLAKVMITSNYVYELKVEDDSSYIYGVIVASVKYVGQNAKAEDSTNITLWEEKK